MLGKKKNTTFNSTEEQNFSASAASQFSAVKNKLLGKYKKQTQRIVIGIAIIILANIVPSIGGLFSSSLNIIKVDASSVNEKNNNNLVYTFGNIMPHELTDTMFNFTASGLAMKRVVEMYQLSKDENGRFVPKWSDSLQEIPQDELKAHGIDEPLEFPIKSEEWKTDKVELGGFTLSPDFVKQIATNFEPIQLTEENFNRLNSYGQNAFKLYNGSYFFGLNPEIPNIGDFRVTFIKKPVAAVSIIGKQTENMLEPYVSNRGTIGLMSIGNKPMEEMSKGLNLGSSVFVKIIFRSLSYFGILIGILVILGKNPIPVIMTAQKKLTKKENDGTVSAEEEIFETAPPTPHNKNAPVPNIRNDLDIEDTDSFAFEPSPVYHSHATEPEETKASDISDLNVTSQLKKLGIINPEDHQYVPAPPTPSNISTSTVADFATPAQFDNFDNSFLPTNNEEIPFGVDVFTEENLDDVAANTTQTASIPDPQAIAPTAIHTHISENEVSIPDSVEIFYEEEEEENNDSGGAMPMAEENFVAPAAPPAPLPAIEIEPMPAAPAPKAPSLSSLPMPDYDNLLAKIVGTAPQTPTTPTPPPPPVASQAPLPPTPVAISAPAPEKSASLPPPDFSKLFPTEVKRTDTPLPPKPVIPTTTAAPVAPPPPVAPVAASAAAASTFDLQGIPEDFDPNAEMLSFDSDDVSPFDIDDPFAVTDDENK